jgi:hypothetical protein
MCRIVTVLPKDSKYIITARTDADIGRVDPLLLNAGDCILNIGGYIGRHNFLRTVSAYNAKKNRWTSNLP